MPKNVLSYFVLIFPITITSQINKKKKTFLSITIKISKKQFLKLFKKLEITLQISNYHCLHTTKRRFIRTETSHNKTPNISQRLNT